MRDVSRMLDAMESTDPAAVALAVQPTLLAPPRTSRRPESSAAPSDKAVAWWATTHWQVVTAGGAGTGATALLILMLRRRRTKAVCKPPPPSIVSHFAAVEPALRASPLPSITPEWVYRRSAFETPELDVITEPVDLLLRFSPVPAMSLTATLRERLAAADTDARLHLVGDEHWPTIRCTGESTAMLQAWRSTLDAASSNDDDDGRLARWLSPSLDSLLARDMPRRDAERLLDGAERHAVDALEKATGDELAHGFARWIRLRLARAARLSGATRLFAFRDLMADIANDPRHVDAWAIDACIDLQLAWASWLLGDAATARLSAAEQDCDRLARIGPDAATRALRRRGEVWLHRAQRQSVSARLSALDRAQALFDDAHERSPNAETALLVAQTAQQRAHLLTATDAAAACSHALLHAFLAEQDPAWRIDALVCRRDIQMIYEALPGHATDGGVAAALERQLLANARSSPDPDANPTT